MIRAVDSPTIRAAIETGDRFGVYCGPDDDLEAVAPYSVLSHLKDMTVVQENQPGRVRFRAQGCALVEGQVDIPRAIQRKLRGARRVV